MLFEKLYKLVERIECALVIVERPMIDTIIIEIIEVIKHSFLTKIFYSFRRNSKNFGDLIQQFFIDRFTLFDFRHRLLTDLQLIRAG